jgi:hypothetical protein
VSKKTPQFFKNPLKIRRLIQRRRAADYLLITLLSFGFSVGATRLFLNLTGFPQLGGGNLHIAHVLWGGLFLFIASLLPIIYVNEWVIALSGLVSGFGVGLFIDEVGKFITQTNDYFYPSAAPIIYALFLMTVFIFAQVRIERRPSTRSIFYDVLERLTEVLDRDLSEEEALEIQRLLKIIIDRNDEPELSQLASSIQTYFDSDKKRLVPSDPTFLEKWKLAIQKFEKQHLSRKRVKTIILSGLLIWAAWSLISPIGYLAATRDPSQVQLILNQLIEQKLITNQSGLTWFEARVLLEGGTGAIALVAAFLFFIKREKAGIWLGIADMLLVLTIVNLLIFYFDQFSTILLAAYQFVLFSFLIRYQRRFLKTKAN